MKQRLCLLFALLCLVGNNAAPAQPTEATAASPNDVQSFEIPESDEGLPGAGPVRRYDWFRGLWRQRRSQWAEQVARDQGALVFLGDSITQGWGDDMGGSFPGVKVANRGISGDTTRGMLLRLREDVLTLDPSGVVLLMGTNDLEEQASPETIADNVGLIVKELKQHNARMPIVLCQIFPSSASKKRPADKIQETNDLVMTKVYGEHSLMLLRHGVVIAEGWWAPYSAEHPHQLYSLSKSYASTAVGLAIAEGKLSLDDPVIRFFPDQLPEKVSENLRSMRVRDLLSMSTGHVREDLAKFSFESDGVLTEEFLALPVQHKPGTHFLYNTAATYMCSAIVQHVTGQRIVDYLQPRLFDPLGIEAPLWTESPQGISHGGYGLNVRTEDIARFGQLYLQRGEWDGRQLLPSEYVAAATARQTSNGSNPDSDWDQGYGYQFWQCRHGHYRGDGAFGQFCIVMPEHDVVLAITSGTADMGQVMQLAWDHLLPAIETGQLPADRDAERKLRETLASLQLPQVAGEPSSPLSDQVLGKSFSFPDNERGIQSITLTQQGDDTLLVLKNADGEHRFRLAYAAWARQRLPSIGSLAVRLPREDDVAVAGSGAWIDNNTYRARLWLFETPFCLDVNLQFNTENEQINFEAEYNVMFGPRKVASLVGKPAP